MVGTQPWLIAISTSKARVERAAVGVAIHNQAAQHPNILAPKLSQKLGMLLAKVPHLLQQRCMALLAQITVDQFLDNRLDRRLLLLRQLLQGTDVSGR